MDIRTVAPAQGWQWIKAAWQIFWQRPMLWLAFSSITVLALVAIASIPVVGEPLAALGLPVLLAGFLSGSRAVQRGESLHLQHLFAGFREHAQSLVALGGVNFVAQLLIIAVMRAAGGEDLVNMIMGGAPPQTQDAAAQIISESGTAIFVGASLYFVLMLAMQFAPALVLFGNARPLEALKASIEGCLGNILPLSVYAGIMLGAGLAIMFLLQGTALMVVAALAMLPIAMAAAYMAYHDIYQADIQAPGESPR